MFHHRRAVVAIAAIFLVASCGGESPTGESRQANGASATLPTVRAEVDETYDATNASPSFPNAATTGESPARASQTVQLDQPALWPASDAVLGTPEEAAASFVSNVLGVAPLLGDFAAGDSRSGEIQVFSPGDGEAAEPLERGLLGVRIIGPNDGWFVIAASSVGLLIESPATLDRVPAGSLVVSGQGRGFESTVVVTAFRAGDADVVLDQVITSGGARDVLEPFSVTLDLSDAQPGDVVALLVRGDTGLDGDPGEFASIPIVIGDPLPETR